MTAALKRRLKNIILDQNLLLPHDKVIVAVSAGPDSVALLCLLSQTELSLSPVAVYVDHGLRPQEVITEIQLVEELATQLHIPYEIVRVDVKKYKKENRSSLEEAARILRYEVLEKCRQKHKAVAIAVAHTADDQAEQILLRLIRGTGLKGLAAIQIRNNLIIRPLLHEKKEDLIKFLKDSHIAYCSDSSNQELTFLRNRVRLDLLPLLEKDFNPSIRKNLLQTADILQKEEALLDQLATEDLTRCVSNTYDGHIHSTHLTLDTKIFLQCHEAIRRRVLEKICWKLEVRPTFRQIEQLHNLADRGKNGSTLHLKEGLRIFRNKENILFTRPCGKRKMRGNLHNKQLKPLPLNREGTYRVESLEMVLTLRYLTKTSQDLPEGSLLLDGEKVTYPLILRTSKAGERFIPTGMKHKKKISRFLSDIKIPRYARHLYPVIVSGNDIVAVAGLRVDQRYAPDKNSACFLQISWIPSPLDSRPETN